jgi:hypothetical protein
MPERGTSRPRSQRTGRVRQRGFIGGGRVEPPAAASIVGVAAGVARAEYALGAAGGEQGGGGDVPAVLAGSAVLRETFGGLGRFGRCAVEEVEDPLRGEAVDVVAAEVGACLPELVEGVVQLVEFVAGD